MKGLPSQQLVSIHFAAGIMVIAPSPYSGKGRPASGVLQQMETAHSERQSLSAPTAEAPPPAWAQSGTPRDLNNRLLP